MLTDTSSPRATINANGKQITLECVHCDFTTPYVKPLANCPKCGENIMRARYDLDALRRSRWLEQVQTREQGMWRYHELLPIYDTDNIVTLGEGSTPLLKAKNLGRMLGLNNLYVKDERQGPTHSFKDRQASVAISVMKEQGITQAVVASTGNVAIAYSAFAARAQIKMWSFMPTLVPDAKMREAAIYGGEVIKVLGTYDQAKLVAAGFAQQRGIFLDKGVKSVAAIESMKTMAFEIAQQLAQQMGKRNGWRVPDWFIQGVSGGMGPIGVAKGFEELRALGAIEKIPALGAIQSSGCNPMVRAFKNGQRVAVPVEDPTTIIATLATGNPGRAYEMLYDLTLQNGGAMEDATDEEAFEATRVVAQEEGLSVEPATAVMFAGLFKLAKRRMIGADEIVVLNCSGHTFPVETQILGEQFAKYIDVSKKVPTVSIPEAGLHSVMEAVKDGVHKILVIDDNDAAARLIQRMLLTRDNLEVVIAHGGADGIRMMERMMPDLVITDLMMPDVDGFALIDAMKVDPHLRDIPVIVVTAKELTGQDKQRLQGQVTHLLQKSAFVDEDLLDSIGSALH